MIVLTDLLSFLQHHICLMRKGFGKMLLVGKSNNIRHSKSATVQVVQHEDDHDTAVFLLMSCFLSFQSSTKPIFASIIRECFFFQWLHFPTDSLCTCIWLTLNSIQSDTQSFYAWVSLFVFPCQWYLYVCAFKWKAGKQVGIQANRGAGRRLGKVACVGGGRGL